MIHIENPVNITPETAICHNPLVHSSTGDRKSLTKLR